MTLENLLNELINLGWKPFGFEDIHKIIFTDSYNIRFFRTHLGFRRSIRDLVSIESGLRQFVCKEGLYNKNGYDSDFEIVNKSIDNKVDCLIEDTYQKQTTGYRLMLSSIQTDLEQFILSNIQLPGQENI